MKKRPRPDVSGKAPKTTTAEPRKGVTANREERSGKPKPSVKAPLNHFAVRLRKAREDAGVTLTALGEATGFGSRSIIRYEQGGAVPSVLAAARIAAHLGASLDDLVLDATAPTAGEVGNADLAVTIAALRKMPPEHLVLLRDLALTFTRDRSAEQGPRAAEQRYSEHGFRAFVLMHKRLKDPAMRAFIAQVKQDKEFPSSSDPAVLAAHLAPLLSPEAVRGYQKFLMAYAHAEKNELPKGLKPSSPKFLDALNAIVDLKEANPGP